jgi:hypothetical protein
LSLAIVSKIGKCQTFVKIERKKAVANLEAGLDVGELFKVLADKAAQ